MNVGLLILLHVIRPYFKRTKWNTNCIFIVLQVPIISL